MVDMVETIDLCDESYENGDTGSHEDGDDYRNGICCLAKWSDRKYYPGVVLGKISNSKFSIIYADGYTKTVAESNIIFGDSEKTLPILNHTVSVLAEKTIVGNCMEILDQLTESPKYLILTEMGNLEVESSEIFLTEDQVKMMKGTYKNNGYGNYNGNGSENSNGVRRSTRQKRAYDGTTSPQPGPSGLCNPKRAKKTNEKEPEISDDDSEYLSDPEPEPIKKRNLSDIEGVQTETQVTQAEQSLQRLTLNESYGSNLDDILGKITENTKIFKGKCFLLTCTYPLNDKKKKLLADKYTLLPFVRSHLENQIKAGGGVVYQNFENVPKNKQKMLRLVAPFSCLTPKYVQCLAAGVPIVSHKWIIDCCEKSKLLDFKEYILPAGFSVIEKKYLDWSQDRSVSHKKQFLPFKNSTIILGSYETDFVEFWSAVCKSAGATVRIAKRAEDITETLNGFLLTQEDFFYRNKVSVEQYNIHIVSTVFVVESLICGKIVDPAINEKLREPFQDEDDPTL